LGGEREQAECVYLFQDDQIILGLYSVGTRAVMVPFGSTASSCSFYPFSPSLLCLEKSLGCF